MCLGGGTRFCSSVPDGRSETDIPPRHFNERHIPDCRAGLGFKDVSQIEQILVGKVRDRGFDLGKAPHRLIALIGDPLILILSMWPSIINVAEAAGALTADWLRSFRKDVRYLRRRRVLLWRTAPCSGGC